MFVVADAAAVFESSQSVVDIALTGVNNGILDDLPNIDEEITKIGTDSIASIAKNLEENAWDVEAFQEMPPTFVKKG